MDAQDHTLKRPPRFVQAEQGDVAEVILSYEDYERFLRILGAHADWETLRQCLQDATDRVLADDAKAAEGSPRPLRELLRETGANPPRA